jgi:hypothetical protein
MLKFLFDEERKAELQAKDLDASSIRKTNRKAALQAKDLDASLVRKERQHYRLRI